MAAATGVDGGGSLLSASPPAHWWRCVAVAAVAAVEVELTVGVAGTVMAALTEVGLLERNADGLRAEYDRIEIAL